MKSWILKITGLLSISFAVGCCTSKLDYFSRFPVENFQVEVIQKEGRNWLKVNAIPIISDTYFTDYTVEYPGTNQVQLTMKGRKSFWGQPAKDSLNVNIENGGESFMRVFVPLPVEKFSATGLQVDHVEAKDGSLIIQLKNI